MSTAIRELISSKPAATDDQERAKQSLRLARMLIDSLPEQMRAELVRELANVELRKDASATGVVAKIIQMVRPGSEVTASSLRKAVADQGVEAAPKEVYNAITYLKRSGKLKRLGYGRYLVHGLGIDTSEDLGGERDRHEDVSDDER
jgi:hypothetical protein